MEIPVLIEPIGGAGYRATAGPPLACSAEGATEEEAIGNLRSQLASRLAGGARLVTVSVPTAPPWLKYAGTWKPDDPVIEEWRQLVEEYRRQVDEDQGTT